MYTRLNYARSRAGEAKPIEGCSMRSGLIYRAIIILHLPLDRSKPASTYKIIRIDRTRARSQTCATFIHTSL